MQKFHLKEHAWGLPLWQDVPGHRDTVYIRSAVRSSVFTALFGEGWGAEDSMPKQEEHQEICYCPCMQAMNGRWVSGREEKTIVIHSDIHLMCLFDFILRILEIGYWCILFGLHGLCMRPAISVDRQHIQLPRHMQRRATTRISITPLHISTGDARSSSVKSFEIPLVL